MTHPLDNRPEFRTTEAEEADMTETTTTSTTTTDPQRDRLCAKVECEWRARKPHVVHDCTLDRLGEVVPGTSSEEDRERWRDTFYDISTTPMSLRDKTNLASLQMYAYAWGWIDAHKKDLPQDVLGKVMDLSLTVSDEYAFTIYNIERGHTSTRSSYPAFWALALRTVGLSL